MNENEIKVKTQEQWFGDISPAFQKAILDQLAGMAKENGGVYVMSVPSLRLAAFAAWDEIIVSTLNADGSQYVISPMLAVAIWEDALGFNGSAFHQALEAKEKAGTLGFKLQAAKKGKTSAIAGGYLKGA